MYDVTQILIALDGFLAEASAYAGPNRVWLVCYELHIDLYVLLWLSSEACGVTGKRCGLSSKGTKKEEQNPS